MKTLIIGYGSIGKRHAQVLGGLDAEIAVVTRQDPTGFESYNNLEGVSDIDGYDYYVIASETNKHFGQLAFLDQNVKGKKILVEKPLFDGWRDVHPVNNQVFVAYNLRFHPVVQEMKSRLQNRKVLYVNVYAGQYLPTWRPGTDYRKGYSAHKEKGGGVLLDLSHEIDYIQWLFGKVEPIAAFNDKISNLDINSDDIVTSIGKTERNAIVSFTMDYISKIPVRNILVHTDELTLYADLIKNEMRVNHLKNPEMETVSFDVDRNFTYRKMHDVILYNEGKDVCSFTEGLGVLETIVKIRDVKETDEKH